MKTNFVQTMKESAKHMNLNRTIQRVALIGLFISLGVGEMWGSSSKTYYSQMNVAASPTGGGTVYVTSSGKTSDTKNSSASSAPTHTYNIYATANDGYKFSSWSGSGITFGSATTANTTGAFSASSTSSSSPTAKTATASFVVVTVNSVSPALVNVDPTNNSQNYTGDIIFATSNANHTGVGDFDATPTTDGKFTIAWSRTDNDVKASYTFNGGGTYGGLSRTNSTKVTLASKGTGGGSKDCIITANFPNAKITDGSAEDIYATFKTADATQAGVERTAVFDVEYVDGTDNFDTPSITGTGASHFTYNSMSYADGKLTVTYTYNGNKEAGDHTATLTLKVNDAIGGTDATYGTKAITVTAHNEQEVDYDVEVYNASGTKISDNTTMWAAGLTLANNNAGSTIKLMRDIDLGTITATQTISKAMTIDLNGRTLQATVTSAIPLLTISATTTITDTKTGGMIYNTGEINAIVYGVTVAAGKTLTVSGGTIKAENTQQYFYGTSSVGGTATNKTSVGARGIQMKATSTVNIVGGTVQGIASRNAVGVYEESSHANTTTLNITGGSIYAEAASYGYGIIAYGKVNMSAGNVTTKINSNTVNGNETYTNYRINTSKALDSYTVNGYGYGIYMHVNSNAAAASCYYGTLIMTGGAVTVTNEKQCLVGTTVQTSNGYGLYFAASATGAGSGKTATDGTKAQKASAIGDISGATITVNNASNYAYGVLTNGYYNSADDTEGLVNIHDVTVNVNAYSSAYGIYANAGCNTSNGGCYAGRVKLKNTNVTATTTGTSTAVALIATGTMTTIKTATSSVYAGEYASSAYMYVESGNYTANSATSYAMAAITGPWTTSNPQRGNFKTNFAVDGSLGGNVESMSGMYISGGTFKANSGTTNARAIWNSGSMVITGGTFEATSTTTNAYAIYANRGTVTATGATFKATGTTGTAYGVLGEGMINDYVGWKYAPTFTLTNCNITATTNSGNTAAGVYLSGTTRTIASVNSSYSSIGDVVLGGYAVKSKATITGCTINATSAGTTAYGVYSINTPVVGYNGNKITDQGELTVKNCNITAKTNGTTTAIGVRAGSSSAIEDNTITVTTATTTSSGIVVGDGTHSVSGNTVTASGTATVYGIQTYSAVNSTTGYKFQADATLEDNTVTATTTTGNTAYAVYVTTADGVAVTTSGYEGSYVAAGGVVINSGKYTATAAGTTAYGVALDAIKTKNGVSGAASCTINGGKFKGTATSTYADVNASASADNFSLAGGYYVNNTNLNTYVADGYAVTSLTSGDAYTEGYRYTIGSGATGSIVCKVYSGSTLKGSYQSLEEALDYVNLNTGTTLTILMTDNYALPAGNYTLPAKATLLVPYSGQTAAKTTSLERVYAYTKPTANIRLSFAPNVSLDVLGTIEVGGKQGASGQLGGYNGAPHLSYGWLYLSEGSSVTLESGAKLFAWGFVTGTGEIDAKRGSTVYEMFQLTDWRGGTAISGMEGNSQKVMPINQYYIQNVECPIKFRPGAVELCEGSCNMSSDVYPIKGKNSSTSIQFIGITGSGSLFMMDDEDVSNDTWVRKRYDAVNDKQVYEINSSAKIGGIDVTCANLPLIGSKTISSSAYIMPITNNMKIHLLSGNMYITQNLELAAGAEIEVDKEATAYVNSGVSLYVFDTDEWDAFSGTTKSYAVRYTPSWSTCPRSVSNIPDAAINVHGKFVVEGSLYTTAGGANIYSTNEDAGTITYNRAASTSSTKLYVCNNTSQTYNEKTYYPAWLKNGAGVTPTYSETNGTAAGKTWSYYDDEWQCWTQSGCFTYDAVNNPYIKPAAYIQVTSDTPDANHLHHDAATGNRNFIWDANCYWWEVETTPTAEGYYKAITADHNGKYNYYEYNSSAGCWVIKTVTISWSINGSTTNYTVNYGTTPKWLGANPTKAATSTYKYEWTGWTAGSTSGTFYAKGADLPLATANTTYYAYFKETKYSYSITFANVNNGESVSATIEAGETPVCPITPVKASTVSKVYTFTNWSGYLAGATLPPVTGTATYTAVFSEDDRTYPITFYNYDGSVLQQTDVAYGSTPAYTASTPTKAADVFYSYTFDTWDPAINSVAGAASYYATYTAKPNVFTVTWVNYNGTVLETDANLTYGVTPTYDGSTPTRDADAQYTYTFTGWSPTVEAVTEDVTYTAQFSQTTRNYTVTVAASPAGYGSVSAASITSVPYGTAVSTSGSTLTVTGKTPVTATPTTATAQYTYVFSSWMGVPATVTGNVTITAVFTRTVKNYTVTWKNADGTTLETDENVPYGTTPAYNGATPAKATDAEYAYTFNTWSPAVSAVTGDVTYTATYTTTPVVASVTINSATTYYTTVDAAFTAANSSVTYDPTITLLRDASTTTTTFISYTGAKNCTLDLNGHTLSSTTAQALLYINKTGNTFTITDLTESKSGSLRLESTSTENRFCVYVAQGNLRMDAGTVFLKSKADTRNEGVRIDPAASTFTMNGGKVQVVTSDGKTACGIASRGVAVINGGAVQVETSGTGYGIEARVSGTNIGNVTVYGGKFLVTGTTAACAYKSDASATLKLQGGYYNTNTDLEANCATNYHVLSLPANDPNRPDYEYEVAEAYDLSWVTDGDALTGDYTNGKVKKDADIIAPNTPTKAGYTFSAWTPAVPATMPSANTTYTATWTCVSPTNLTIASDENKWDFCNGETMTLTVSSSANNIAADATYLWKISKDGGTTYSNAPGTNNEATYTVTSMEAANAGKYTCTVTNGSSCPTTSAGVDVKVWYLHINNGVSGAWQDIAFTNTGTGTGSANVTLEADQSYGFKLWNELGESLGWYGLDSKTISATESNITLNSTGANVSINAGLGGTYVFTIDYTSATSPKISVTYPTANQPSGRKIYFDKSVIADWGSNVYYRVGKSSHNSNQTLSLVPGTDQFYEMTTNGYDGFEAWQIANNTSWADDNSIYLVNGSGYEITKGTTFQKYVVGASGVTLVPNTPKTGTSDGCDYFAVTKTDGMLTHTATITAPTNGTITISNTDQSLSETATKAGIPHRTILTITATPNSGYRCTSLTVNGEPFTSGNTFILAANATIAATFESAETGFWLDIIDVDNSAKKLTLNVSGWANAWPYDVNGDTYYRDEAKATAASSSLYRQDDRTMTIPYTGEVGSSFDITIKNAENTIVSKHSYTIPQAVTTNTTLAENQTKNIYVKNATLTINADITAKNIYVGPDAKLVVNSGKTLTADSIFLRTTPTKAAELTKDGTVASKTKVFYTRIISDKSGYFPFGLPLTCKQTIEEVRLSNGSDPKYATGSGWILREYSESNRATKGAGDENNWQTLAKTTSIAGGKGYEMYSGVNYYREFYFPVDLSELTDKVAVARTTEGVTDEKQAGWNVIVSPLTSTYTNDPAPEDITVSWMYTDGFTSQEIPSIIAPATVFSYQAAKTGTISFKSNALAVAAPRRMVAAAEEPTRIQWIHLDVKDGNGVGDQTSIYSHPTRYEEVYQSGIDVAKQSLTASRAILYSSHAYGDMAFAGVADSLLEKGVALTVYSPSEQELTISMRENNWLNRMAAVWLIDHETGMTTDLLWNDYTFDAVSGTMSGRFTIQGIFRAPGVATDIEPTSDSSLKGREKARKVIIDQKIYIMVNGRIYDTTGKLVEGK